MRITVLTPTYNRAYILDRLYRSLKRQSFFDFEWLVIDDGSDDDTESLVNRWMDDNNGFSVRYYKKPNGGKCSAINRGLELAEGSLFLVVDSDDWLTDDALEKIDRWERALPKNERYCGISGNLGLTAEDTSNALFPNGFYDGSLLDRYKNVDGERAYAFYTDIHRQYMYPVIEGENFMTEAVVYNRMAHDGYKMRFYNDVVCVYEYLEDGLTSAGNKLFLKNPRGYALWLREKNAFVKDSFLRRFRLWYSFYCEMTFCDEQYRLTKKQCADYISAPLWAMYSSSILHKLRQVWK